MTSAPLRGPETPAREWTSRYEDLRRQVQQPTAASCSAGRDLAVLLQRGVTAWMRVWSDCVPPSAASTSFASRSAIAGPATFLSELSDQWARLLVDMLLHHSQEVCA